MDKVIRNGKEFETRNGQKIGNRNEFGMGNGHKWNRIHYKKHNFFYEKRGGNLYRHNAIREALFSTANGKNSRNAGTEKMQYNMIRRNVIH